MAKNTPYTGPVYTITPNKAWDVLVSKKLGKADMLVYQILCRHYNFDENKCWPSLATIGKLTNMAARNVSRSINALCANGMVLRMKSKSSNNAYDQNSYFLPHLVAFQVENLSEDPKKNKKKIEELKNLQIYLSKEIEAYQGTLNMRIGILNMKEGSLKKDEGILKAAEKVVSPGPSNNTTINTTINITKNVKDNDEEPIGLNQKRSLSIRGSSQHIGEIDALIRIKHEGLVQELTSALNDHKSIPFYRKLVSKFSDHEDSIYKCLSLTKETGETTGINKSRGAVFTDHIKREAVRLGIEI